MELILAQPNATFSKFPRAKTYTMNFDSYQQMPADKQDEIVRRVRGA